tara:strand:+ start:520 stop:702 length:183 start_codon:yes stop_codon:yes gene_type:complete
MRELDVDAAGLTDINGLGDSVLNSMRFVPHVGRIAPFMLLQDGTERVQFPRLTVAAWCGE